MIPNPLHPAVVHFPIVLVTLLPLAAVAALVLLRRGGAVLATWGWVVALAVALPASAWVSMETGEDQEELVEDFVGDAPIHEHEEAAELFLFLTLGGLVVIAAGLAPGRVGRFARYSGTACALGLLAAGIQVGHTGGQLVYEHGAAQAYVTQVSGEAGPAGRDREPTDDDDRDDGRGGQRDRR